MYGNVFVDSNLQPHNIKLDLNTYINMNVVLKIPPKTFFLSTKSGAIVISLIKKVYNGYLSFQCHGSDGKLILHYCNTQAWG